ncbi:ABC transporter permease [Sutcliffiella rhizosphaerae]|uniref:Linearmycin resistance permease protein LnrM n=1 Tax=Sutcliffiella rhizosphaerae TaxID=2880967 RepID=A0ABN8ADC2_9BACI|nr:ABC transporter permease [Sutcliffiella rhizosphaerae]CAG9622082.1 Linearmycin resistance permease protein LnrM [Sutcliffiella rhizosphaerae]
MLKAFIYKDFLHLLRDKKEVLMLLAMPFILISILGFAFGGSGNNGLSLHTHVAVVDEGSLEEGLEQLQEWMGSQGIPESAQQPILMTARETSLPEVLINNVMKKNLTDLVTIDEVSDTNAAVESTKYAGVIKISAEYRLETWKSQFFDEPTNLQLELLLNRDKGLEASVVSDIVEKVTEQLRLQTVLTKEAHANNQLSLDLPSLLEIDGEKVALDGKKPVNSFEYFAVGMSTMFALYVISFVAGYAYYEKTTFVYDRILLSNTSPFIYATSKWISAVFISYLQLCILYGLAALVYKVYWSDLLAFFILTFFFSLVIGSMTVLITALSYRYNTNQISSIFSAFLVSVFAFIGGSFASWREFSDTMYQMGSFTPNGAALQGYVKILSGGGLSDITPNLWSLTVLSVLMLVIAIPCYPRRRSN